MNRSNNRLVKVLERQSEQHGEYILLQMGKDHALALIKALAMAYSISEQREHELQFESALSFVGRRKRIEREQQYRLTISPLYHALVAKYGKQDKYRR